MSDKSNKSLLYVAAGAAVVIGGALLFNYISNSSSASSSQCFEEIDQLGPPKKDPNGLLNFGYYKDVFLIISKHAKGKFADEKKELVARRRSCLKDGKMDEYRQIIEQLIMKEESSFQDLINEAMDHIGLTE